MKPSTALLGEAPVMRDLRARIACVAKSDAPVLIVGETGTGKELVARAVHEASPRAGRPFVVIDCGALAATLLESELYGHTRGAFTGADVARVGAIEAAEGGTVFLDEIGEFPLAVQPRLLRVLGRGEVRRVGENTHRPVHVRFVAATHRDLRAMVDAKTFREDLLYRLDALQLDVPPLRARRDDIGYLAEHFLGEEPDEALLAALRARPWPGNVRELRNAIEHHRVFASLDRAPAADSRMEEAGESHALPSMERLRALPLSVARREADQAFERAYILGLVAKHGAAAEVLATHARVDKSMIYRLIRRHIEGAGEGPRR